MHVLPRLPERVLRGQGSHLVLSVLGMNPEGQPSQIVFVPSLKVPGGQATHFLKRVWPGGQKLQADEDFEARGEKNPKGQFSQSLLRH